MKIISVKCQGQTDQSCANAYDGCKKRIMYSEFDCKIICKDGEVTIAK